MEQPILYSNRDMPKNKVQISCGIADYSKINPEAHKQLAYQNKTNPGLNAKKNPPPCFNSKTEGNGITKPLELSTITSVNMKQNTDQTTINLTNKSIPEIYLDNNDINNEQIRKCLHCDCVIF